MIDTVREWMSPNPIVVRPQATVAECARFMHAHHVRHLPVVGENGRCMGVVVDADVFALGNMVEDGQLGRWQPLDGASGGKRALDLAIPFERYCDVDEAASIVVRRWPKTPQDFMLVFASGSRLVGILTEHDVVLLALDVLVDPLSARHVATRPVVSVGADSSVGEAWHKMTAAHIRHMLVLDERGRVLRVLSYRDLVKLGARDEPHFPMALLGEQDVVSVPEGSSVKHAASLMAQRHLGCLPVVGKDGRVQGVMTRRDILDVLVGALDERVGVALDDGTESGWSSHGRPETVRVPKE